MPVRVVRSDEHAVAGASRYAGPRLAWPAAGGDEARVRYLLDLAERERLDGWVLIPTHDEEAALVARHHDALARRYRLTTLAVEPAPRGVRQAVHARAGSVARARRSRGRRSPQARRTSARADGRFPVVVKPAYKEHANRLTVDKAWRADDPATLRRRYEEACELVDRSILMVQELIPGDGAAQLSFAALCDDGNVLASLTARRTRQFPMDFGRASSYVETIDDPGVERDARRLLAATRLTGIVEVEFKRDPRTGENLLLDVNPRAWGWQSLCGARGRGLPVPAVADGERSRGAAGAGRRRASAGCGWSPTCWPRRASCAPAACRQRAYLRSLRRPLEFAVFARGRSRSLARRPARHRAPRRRAARGGTTSVTATGAALLARVELDPLHDPRWPDLLVRAGDATAFHHSAWLALVHGTYGYDMTACCVTGDGGRLWRACLWRASRAV